MRHHHLLGKILNKGVFFVGIKMTIEGKQRLESEIKKIERDLEILRHDKNIAYESSGDTWHDNPYFKMLESAEATLLKNIREKTEKINFAEIVEKSEKKNEIISIGSIVKCKCVYADGIDINVFEIVGHGESDPLNGKVNYDSPVGKSLLGCKVGDTVSITTPGGLNQYTILRFYNDWKETDNDID